MESPEQKAYRDQWYHDYMEILVDREKERNADEPLKIITIEGTTYAVRPLKANSEDHPEKETGEDHPGSQSE